MITRDIRLLLEMKKDLKNLWLRVGIIMFIFSMPGVTKAWVCDYWLADIYGWQMNKLAAEKNVGWLLHGVWNEIGTSKECITYDEFLVFMHKKFEDGELAHFLDASPKSGHTCCKGQWHEYFTHGCKQENTFNEWWSAVENCLKSFNPPKLYVHRCRHDLALDCNAVEEVSSEDIGLLNCKVGKKYCTDVCFRDFDHSFCQVNTDRLVRNFFYSIRFKTSDLQLIDEVQEPINCHCRLNLLGGMLYRDVSPVDVHGIDATDREINSREVEREYDYHTTVEPEEQIFVSDGPSLNCTCVDDSFSDKKWTEQDIEEAKTYLDFYRFKPSVVNALYYKYDFHLK